MILGLQSVEKYPSGATVASSFRHGTHGVAEQEEKLASSRAGSPRRKPLRLLCSQYRSKTQTMCSTVVLSADLARDAPQCGARASCRWVVTCRFNPEGKKSDRQDLAVWPVYAVVGMFCSSETMPHVNSIEVHVVVCCSACLWKECNHLHRFTSLRFQDLHACVGPSASCLSHASHVLRTCESIWAVRLNAVNTAQSAQQPRTACSPPKHVCSFGRPHGCSSASFR